MDADRRSLPDRTTPSRAAAAPRLVIFDCDGVLVDTEPTGNAVLVELLGEIGLEIGLDESMATFRGRSMPACWAIVEARLGRPVPPGTDAEFDRREREAFARAPLRMPGLSAALAGIDALGLATCVASNGAHAKMRVTLGAADLWERFEGRIFSAESDVERGKPHPDVFLHAAGTLGFDPAECIVVEDSPLGVQAGCAAGMRVLGFAREVGAEALQAAGADVFSDLAELPERLAALSRPRRGAR